MHPSRRYIQHKVNDLAERLLICELALHQASDLPTRVKAYHEVRHLINRVESIRTDAEELLHSDEIIRKLERKAAQIVRCHAYSIAAWFEEDTDCLSSFIVPIVFDPLRSAKVC